MTAFVEQPLEKPVGWLNVKETVKCLVQKLEDEVLNQEAKSLRMGIQNKKGQQSRKGCQQFFVLETL